MNRGDYTYIWQSAEWPSWRFDLVELAKPMAEASQAQGLLLGRLSDVGMALRDQANLAALTEDVMKTSEIEDERLNVDSVRSSIARKLGVDIGALAPIDRHVEGVVAMVLDATTNCHAPVSRERLFGWHAQTAAHSDFIAFQPRFSASAMPTTTSSSGPRRDRWMSPSGSPGFSLCFIARSIRHSTCWTPS